MAAKWLYSDKVLDHFRNPRNVLDDSEDFEADAEGEVGNIKCGDMMAFYLKVDPDGLRITDCRWRTFGCASAIASTSVLSEMVKGMTLEEAWEVDAKSVVAELGGLPENKVHCSVLGDKALRAAINDYYRRHGMEDRVREPGSRTVCECLQVTEGDIEDAVLEGTRTFYQLQEHTKIATSCGQCEDEARELLEHYLQKHFGDQGCAIPEIPEG